jgi:hypothetical protein
MLNDVQPFSPASGVQISLGTPQKNEGLANFAKPFYFVKMTFPTLFSTSLKEIRVKKIRF